MTESVFATAQRRQVASLYIKRRAQANVVYLHQSKLLAPSFFLETDSLGILCEGLRRLVTKYY